MGTQPCTNDATPIIIVRDGARCDKRFRRRRIVVVVVVLRDRCCPVAVVLVDVELVVIVVVGVRRARRRGRHLRNNKRPFEIDCRLRSKLRATFYNGPAKGLC